MSADDRIATLRWALINNRRKPHLWLGGKTACELVWAEDAHHLEVTELGDNPCAKCHAYARGWLDRHDHGARWKPNTPNPTGYMTRLEVTR